MKIMSVTFSEAVAMMSRLRVALRGQGVSLSTVQAADLTAQLLGMRDFSELRRQAPACPTAGKHKPADIGSLQEQALCILERLFAIAHPDFETARNSLIGQWYAADPKVSTMASHERRIASLYLSAMLEGLRSWTRARNMTADFTGLVHSLNAGLNTAAAHPILPRAPAMAPGSCVLMHWALSTVSLQSQHPLIAALQRELVPAFRIGQPTALSPTPSLLRYSSLHLSWVTGLTLRLCDRQVSPAGECCDE